MEEKRAGKIQDVSENEMNEADSGTCKCCSGKYYNLAWRNTKDYQCVYCQHCGMVKEFHWKSLWRRVKCVFINHTMNP